MDLIPRRRRLLAAAAFTPPALTLSTLTGLPASAQAQAQAAFPSKPIRLVVPFAAGGGTDVLARVIAEKLQASLGQTVVVDNKPGAAGIIGTDAVAKAAPDGYTLVLSLSNALLTNQFLYDKLPYHPEKDLAPVYQIALGPLVLVTHPSVPAKTGPELLKYVAANKGKLAYGSYGMGAYPHLAGSLMSSSQHADMTHAAYKGEAPMVQDLVGGQIQLAFASVLQAKPQIDAGKLNAIGVSGERRLAALPQVPTLAEQGLKDETYRLTGWLAVAAPARTPAPIIQRLADEIRKATRLPDVQQRVAAMGFELLPDSSPEAFRAAMARERPAWERLIKQTGVKLE